ncbi:proline-rich transmembrane protein 4-like [Xenia sp. Carnegie-2017]|uniref:proline-rich transmembrane protein 4-like n=1 Tax=Xenia sp. Carnegie-2017 TaxID=2897299 RepID=UPI001F04D43B|nr:proline-rich transmembrane protein 4-like [Xenia sp. Carnegie-2017]
MVEELSWPQRSPDWPKAKKTWGLYWQVHVYLFAGFWTIATVCYFALSIKSITRLKNGRKRTHFTVLATQLLFVALSRCFVLFLNPYGSKSTNLIGLVITIGGWSLGTAGLTSALGVLLLILLDTTRVSLGSPRFQNLRVLLAITASIVVFVIITDVIVALHNEAKILLLLCEMAVSIWGLVTMIGYVLVAARIRRNLRSTLDSANPNSTGQRLDQYQRTRLTRILFTCFGAAFLGFVMFGTSLYAVFFGSSSVLSDEDVADVWRWWAFQTTFRVLEMLITLSISLITFQTPREAVKRDNRKPSEISVMQEEQ